MLAACLLGSTVHTSAVTNPDAPQAADKPSLPEATVNGEGPGWRALGEKDFQNVNCFEDTWAWEGNLVKCTGNPVGVTRSPVSPSS